MPKISFIMPMKNRGNIIGDTIETIIQQEESDWELIVVDDHSDTGDKTEDVIKNFGDDRIKFIRIPDRWSGGIPEARNFGNVIAQASIIAVCDSDDLYSPKRAKVTIDAFTEKNCDVFYSNINILEKEKGIIRERKPEYRAREFNIDEYKKNNFIPHMTSAYKTEIAFKYPYNSFFRIAEDYDFFSRLAQEGKKFYFCKENLATRVSHNESTLRQFSKEHLYLELLYMNRNWINQKNRFDLIKEMISD